MVQCPVMSQCPVTSQRWQHEGPVPLVTCAICTLSTTVPRPPLASRMASNFLCWPSKPFSLSSLSLGTLARCCSLMPPSLMVTLAVPLCLEALLSPSLGWLPFGFPQVPPFMRGLPHSPSTVLPFLSRDLPSHSTPFNISTFQETLSDFWLICSIAQNCPRVTLLFLFSSQHMSL